MTVPWFYTQDRYSKHLTERSTQPTPLPLYDDAQNPMLGASGTVEMPQTRRS